MRFLAGGTAAGGNGEVFGIVESDGPAKDLQTSGNLSVAADLGPGGVHTSQTNFAVEPGPLYCAEVTEFKQPYSNRCPQDRVLGVISVRNAGTEINAFASRAASRFLPEGDGGCNQSYESLGIHPHQKYEVAGVASIAGDVVVEGGGI